MENIQHPTSNIEQPIGCVRSIAGHWMLVV
jgi:hypothetical protein